MWNCWKKKAAYKNASIDVKGERKRILDRGHKLGYTLDVSDPWRRYIVSTLVENQTLINETCTQMPVLKDLSVDVVKKLWSEIIIPDLVSVQPMIGPNSEFIYRKGYAYFKDQILAKTRKMKATPPQGSQDLRSTLEDQRDDMVSECSNELKNEITREVFTDIRNNAGSLVQSKDFSTGIEQLQNVVAKKLLQYYGEKIVPNWIVRAPLESDGDMPSTDIIETHRTFNGMRLYIDPLFPTGAAIVGYKGNEFESSYHYAPYVPLTAIPVILDPEGFCPRIGLMTRYGKKLIQGGSMPFGRLSWNESFKPFSSQ